MSDRNLIVRMTVDSSQYEEVLLALRSDLGYLRGIFPTVSTEIEEQK